MADDDRLSAALEGMRKRRTAALSYADWHQVSRDAGRLQAALDAVLAEHTQHVTSNFPAPGICTAECLPWPCPTVQAITRALLGGAVPDA